MPSLFRYERPYHHWRNSRIANWATIIISLIVIAVYISIRSGSLSIPASSYERTPLDTGAGFDSNCIIDELGWFENIPRTSRRLQYFFTKTGVQPFIYLRAYDPSLQTDDQKRQFAEDWYESNISDEVTFLFMYFAEQDQDGDVGYMAYVDGKRVSAVMDAEAVEIFWAYTDQNWYSDQTTDDMFVDIFRSTADRIMRKTTTALDIAKIVLLIVLVSGGAAAILIVMKTRRKHEKERNAETERILAADLDKVGDPTLEKWSKDP